MDTVDFSENKFGTFIQARHKSIHISQGESLIPIGPWVLNDQPEILNDMWLWRRTNASFFFFDELPSLESFTKYLTDGPIFTKQRILFLVVKGSTPVGHLGLATHDEERATVDNVLRGVRERVSGMTGVMERSLQAMISWANKNHGIRRFELEVRSDNTRALEFYKRCGFSILEVESAWADPGFSQRGFEDLEELRRIVMLKEI